jgi:hypothetical protein
MGGMFPEVSSPHISARCFANEPLRFRKYGHSAGFVGLKVVGKVHFPCKPH